MTEPFNPLDVGNLAHSIVTRMMETDPAPLDKVHRFTGAGLYAIYYAGDFPAYEDLSKRNKAGDNIPIYVGKAVPQGGRRGVDVVHHTRTRALSDRIRQHAASVRAASNLRIEDFSARWIVVDDIWIPLGESALIRQYRPVWNTIVDGFGNHDPGAGRRRGVRSRWDTFHPGRPWVDYFPERSETPVDIAQEVTEYLRSRL